MTSEVSPAGAATPRSGTAAPAKRADSGLPMVRNRAVAMPSRPIPAGIALAEVF